LTNKTIVINAIVPDRMIIQAAIRVPVVTVVAAVVVVVEEEEDVVASRICGSAVSCVQPQRIFWIHSLRRLPRGIFFHYSQLQGMHAADLHMDDKVEFCVGTSAKDADKLAAFQVR